MEDGLIKVTTIRHLEEIELIRDGIPDGSTILAFRNLDEKHDLSKQIFETVKAHLKQKVWP
jgi:IS5 family transposase